VSSKEIRSYQYLWDGSQPGWVLTRLYGSYVEVSLKFGQTGPTTRELMAVRRSVSEFKSLPLNQVIEQLRGHPILFLGRLESRQARGIAAACRSEGLNVLEKAIDAPRFLPTNEITNSVLVIEDDELAKCVYESALQHGIPVRHVEN
jgi:hypothetical protein